ncbi:hypothetical protein LZ32DRAFT_209095 [Colletotrichum eremochloae]|nr:hypothetical protein LZ32DRAFT_209095 [Colletotrichum eremochloae]
MRSRLTVRTCSWMKCVVNKKGNALYNGIDLCCAYRFVVTWNRWPPSNPPPPPPPFLRAGPFPTLPIGSLMVIKLPQRADTPPHPRQETKRGGEKKKTMKRKPKP